MTDENLLSYGVWLLPPMVIFLTACTKNRILFLIGLLTSIFISYSLYVNYSYLPFLLESQTSHLLAEWFDAHRSFVVMDVMFYGSLKTLLYSLLLGVIFWNICSIKSKNSASFRAFSKTSSFYFILFFGTIIDIGLSSLSRYIHWAPTFLSFFLVLPFLIKALLLKYPASEESRGKTSKLTWAMLIFFILFFGYNILWKWYEYIYTPFNNIC